MCTNTAFSQNTQNFVIISSTAVVIATYTSIFQVVSFTFLLTRPIFLVHLILLYLITQTIFSEKPHFILFKKKLKYTKDLYIPT